MEKFYEIWIKKPSARDKIQVKLNAIVVATSALHQRARVQRTSWKSHFPMSGEDKNIIFNFNDCINYFLG